jgi:hypothetical protein
MARTPRAPRRTRRHLIERTHSIDVRRLKRNSQIAPGETAITLCTVADGRSSKIRLADIERPVFGGVRTYFHCPYCDRRCDLLYACPHIACRRRHRLAFASENEPRVNRALRRLLKQRERLGQTVDGIVAPFPNKPKWARWPRYLRTRRAAMQREREYAMRAKLQPSRGARR